MDKQILHITSGGSTTSFLKELKIEGEIVTWQEMLCEGPTHEMIHTDKLILERKHFLGKFYGVDLDMDKVNYALKQLDNANERYTEIVLWFDYHLYSHINMLAVINLLLQKHIDVPKYLVCSGRASGSKELKNLSELSAKQITTHYKQKIKLLDSDLDLARNLWKVYCGLDHNLLKPYIIQSSSFKYLSNCLKAHLERFPDSKTGLNSLETNILRLIKDNEIKSKHHLLGYALNYQGFYGYGNLQLERIIEYLQPFFTFKANKIELNSIGHKIIDELHNTLGTLNNDMIFGGIKKYHFKFSKTENKLIKS